LKYKDIPFVTLWVEYSEISVAMKSIGATPIGRKDRHGSDVYTIPVLSDPNTGAIITDSIEIASYLEKTYPEKLIFPNNSESFVRTLNSTHHNLIFPAYKSIFARTAEKMCPASAKFFTEARSLTVPLPWDVGHDEDWDLLEQGYNTMYEWYQKGDGKWIVDDTFSYADITVASSLLWYKRVLKEDEWARISSWNGGKWAQVLADVEQECKLT
jgi:glutathione S-transferase